MLLMLISNVLEVNLCLTTLKVLIQDILLCERSSLTRTGS